MNFGGKDWVSRRTHSSGRAVLILSIAIILVRWLGIPTEQVELLGVEIGNEQLVPGATVVVVILTVSHFINWRFDVLALQSWNSAMAKDAIPNDHTANLKLSSQLEQALKTIENVKSRFSDDDLRAQDLSATLRTATDSLSEINSKVWWHERFAILYVIVWTFIVPTVAAVVAIIVLNSSYFGAALGLSSGDL